MESYKEKSQKAIKRLTDNLKESVFETSKNREMWEKLKNKWRNG
jgi:hypothetical protein